MNTIKTILLLCVSFTSLNSVHNGSTTRKIGSQKEDRQYTNKTPQQLAKINNLRKIDQRKRRTTKSISKARTDKYRESPSDQQYTLLTWLGAYHGSTPQEAQQQYDGKSNERWEIKEKEEKIKEKEEEEKKRWGIETEEEAIARYTQMYDDWEKDDKKACYAYYAQMYNECEVKQEREEQEREEQEREEQERKQREREDLIYFYQISDEQDLEKANAKAYTEEDAQWLDTHHQDEINELTNQFHREEKRERERKNRVLSSLASKITIVSRFANEQ